MTWLLLILYVSGAGHSPATLTTVPGFSRAAACETAAVDLQRRVPARFTRAHSSVATFCLPQQGPRRHG